MTAPRQMSLEAGDEALLREAIGLAAASVADGDLPYGSLVSNEAGVVIARAHNTVRSSGDITAHPELVLARWAASTYTAEQCTQLTLYTSCQPCPMCTNAIARSGLGRVVYALSTEQLHQLQPAQTPRPDAFPVHYSGPALQDEAAAPITTHYGIAARLGSCPGRVKPGLSGDDATVSTILPVVWPSSP